MKVSICMASYNREPEVLRQVFHSIFQQSPPFEFEVIVCDDGSRGQATRDVCREYPIQYHRIDRSPSYRNPCVARNVTYRAAIGDVIIAQSDEVVHITPNSIERLVRYLETNPCNFVIATVNACGPNGNPWSVYTGLERKVPYFFLGSLWRSDLYAVGGNDEDFAATPGYDDEWFAQCLINGLQINPVYAPTIVGHHLYHPCRITKEHANTNSKIGAKKRKKCQQSGVWCSSGGPWPCNSPGPSPAERIFTGAYQKNTWGDAESCSGQGSSITATQPIRRAIPQVLQAYNIKSLLDIPCGDYHWMQYLNYNSTQYLGADVVRELIKENQRKFNNRDFRYLDITSSHLPKVDMVFCRDCFGHLSIADTHRALENVKASGSKYLLATTFFNHPDNRDIPTGPGWVPRSLTCPPFNLPPPELVVDELCRESYPQFNDKSLALWNLQKL